LQEIAGNKIFMFERYTEKARRVIFAAVFMARRVGSPMIETEHLLLGLLREDKSLARRFLGSPWAAETVLKSIEKIKPAREKISGSFEVPLSSESKRVLAYAAEEADLLSSKSICTEHVLLGLLREEECLAAKTLSGDGVDLASTREALRLAPHDSSATENFIREPGPLPQEIVELQTRIKSINARMQEAIAANDFSKSQSCSDEEGKGRDKLYLLYRRYGLADWIFD
jgi:ATP-dependent Clp protease ATP-binding subunit ClpC